MAARRRVFWEVFSVADFSLINLKLDVLTGKVDINSQQINLRKVWGEGVHKFDTCTMLSNGGLFKAHKMTPRFDDKINGWPRDLNYRFVF